VCMLPDDDPSAGPCIAYSFVLWELNLCDEIITTTTKRGAKETNNMPKYDADGDTPRGCCTHCGGALRPVGTSRKRGKAHPDWGSRSLHKRCWRELKETKEGRKWTSRARHAPYTFGV